MKIFSQQGEKLLKEFFTSNKKEKAIFQIEIIEKKINSMEKGITSFIASDYSKLIDECSYLDELKEKMRDIRMVNTDVFKIANNLNYNIQNNLKDEEELNRCEERLEMLKRELKQIEEYLELNEMILKNINRITNGNKDITCDIESDITADDEIIGDSSTISGGDGLGVFYETVKSLLKMKNMLNSFTKYYFQGAFKSNFEFLIEKFKLILFLDIDRLLKIDSTEVGKNYKINENMFNENHLDLKKEINNILVTIYCIKRLDLENEIIKKINEKRSEIFEKYQDEHYYLIGTEKRVNSDNNGYVKDNNVSNRTSADKKGNIKKDVNRTRGVNSKITSDAVTENNTLLSDDIVCFYMGYLLISNWLIKHFKNCKSFYFEIFNDISNLNSENSNNFNNSKAENLFKLRHLIYKDLKVKSHLTVADESFEKFIFNFFDKKFKIPEILNLKKDEILENIEKSIKFLEKINFYKGEFNELFYRKIDDCFIFLLNNTEGEAFFEMVEMIKNEFNLEEFNKKFEYFNEIEKSIEKMAEKEVSSFGEFSKKKNTEEITKRIIEMERYGTKEFRRKFVETLEKKMTEIFGKRSKDDQTVIYDSARRNLLK
jgi:hypothetical protein